jgi:putative transposase
MGQQDTHLAELTDTQRSEAFRHFQMIRPFLEDGVPLTRIAMEHQLPLRTLRRWAQRYRTDGLVGLARLTRRDKDQRRVVTAHTNQFSMW